VVICLERGANDLHAYGPADATAIPSSLASLKSWYQLTQVVFEIGIVK